ncbi:MAG TPA: SelB C-terminal domain-containing protein, partial [Candidatus Methanoperedens sp.]|nr:SelB C-terminal domain-containing protein [Candidatus Methanoperedens sp.]
ELRQHVVHGTGLEVDPARQRLAAGADPAQSAPLLVLEAGLAGAGREALARRINLETGAMNNVLAQLVRKGSLLEVAGSPPLWVHGETAAEFERRVTALLGAHHAAEPLKPGLPKEELKSKFPAASPRVFAALLERLAQAGTVATEQDLVRLATHRVRLRVDQEEVRGKVEAVFRRAGLQAPALDAVAQELRLEQRAVREAAGLLVADKRLVKITEEILIHEEHLAPLRAKVVAFLKGGAKLGMPEFKDLSGVSRKYSVPLLEHFDRAGLTIRVGDQRVLRKSAGG